MFQPETKTARLEARLPESVLGLLRQAADLQGRSLSDFVVCSAREAAERAIADHDVLRLSLADQKQFAAQLAKPKKPTAAMKRAAKRHSDLIEPS
ncbi:type II toxin-antitoxin system TacA family antitoxin [Posidoniimonas polymericola]|nr:DUF1778 domain-containing protein [Posidoniimonas polymericola]